MDTRNLRPDPCDNRIIRFSNCVQLLACVFNILALVESSFRDLAQMLDIVADVVYLCTSACMTAQSHHEITRVQQMAQPVVLNWVAVQNMQDFRFQQKFNANGTGGAVMPGRLPQQQQVVYPQAGVQMQPQYAQQQQMYMQQQQMYAPQQQVYAPQQQPMYR